MALCLVENEIFSCYSTMVADISKYHRYFKITVSIKIAARYAARS